MGILKIKIPIFGLLKREDEVCAKIIVYGSVSVQCAIIAQKVIRDSIKYFDWMRVYNEMVISDFMHCRISLSMVFVNNQNKIIGISDGTKL